MDEKQISMKYIQFIHQRPALSGSITVNGRSKSGIFMPEWSKYSNSIIYRYHTDRGNKGTGGFSLNRAFFLLNCGRLSILRQ